MTGFVLDAGSLIALERRSTFMLDILAAALASTVELVIPRTVVAQVWRGEARQVPLARLLKAATRLGHIAVDELTAERARLIGATIGTSGHPDIVDVHVALVAGERGHAVLTSDGDDILQVDPRLVVVHV